MYGVITMGVGASAALVGIDVSALPRFDDRGHCGCTRSGSGSAGRGRGWWSGMGRLLNLTRRRRAVNCDGVVAIHRHPARKRPLAVDVVEVQHTAPGCRVLDQFLGPLVRQRPTLLIGKNAGLAAANRRAEGFLGEAKMLADQFRAVHDGANLTPFTVLR